MATATVFKSICYYGKMMHNRISGVTMTLYLWQDPKEPDNIHEVMYDIATKCGKTTTQLDPVGGSENFQGGSENIHG